MSKILILLMLLACPQIEGNLQAASCRVKDHLRVQHEYHRPGDVNIGEMTSQLFSPPVAPTPFNEIPQAEDIYM